jgi:hypothetical protein
MSKIAGFLAIKNYILRSGGADGADSAFEAGCDLARGSKEIYLPWKGFNNNPSELYTQHPKAFEIAAKFHPSWDKLKDSVKKLMARNVHQVLGNDLGSPVEFVVCWTPNGLGGGGTGQALRLAKSLDIKIFDLGKKETILELREFAESL